MKTSPRRKHTYTDSFVDGQLDKMYKLKDECEENHVSYPHVEYLYLSEHALKQLKKDIDGYVKYRVKLGVIKGFWDGYSLGLGVKQ